ncbi:MAG: DUF2807 domain-containing protein [Candidatus Aminicenantes bacterium]|nr:DUF2807 domain-containing protein [Candidatus Aminicenantes bacterium]
MKKCLILFSVLLVLMLSLGAKSCDFDDFSFNNQRIRGSGRMDEETRNVRGVTGVKLATIGLLTVELGNKEDLVIEAEDNLLEYFETEVTNGILTIRTRRHVSIRPRREVRYLLIVKRLESVSTSSSGDIRLPDIKTDRFTIRVNSSGDITAEDFEVNTLSARISSSGNIDMERLEADKIDVHISSSGDLRINDGVVNKQEITISSSGNYQAGRLESKRADVRVSSSGDAYIHAEDYLYARISSSGNIYYSGNPDVDKRITSSGKLYKR